MAVTETVRRPTGAERYLEAFGAFAARAGGAGWLEPARREALRRFGEAGFPTARDEDWRFTSLTALAQTPFGEPRAEGLDAAALAALVTPGLSGPRVVFVNGRFAPALSALQGTAGGVRVRSLAEAMATDRALLERHLARHASLEQPAFAPFVAWNTAFMAEGAVVEIPRGAAVREPIHLVHVAVPGAAPFVVHPRHLILQDSQSEAAIVEEYVALRDGVYLTNAVTEAVVGDNAFLEHYFIQRESALGSSVSLLRTTQGRSSTLTSHSVLFGGGLVRRNIHPELAGEGGDCVLNGLFMANGRQHMDNYMRVEHAQPHCSSRQFFRGVLDGHAHGVFHGRIVVHKDAQKTDAKQTNMNLLLSEEAQIDTKPQLEIYADDVKCTHGATIGQIDDDAIFYLRSRGIPADTARALLLFAFAGETLDRMKVEAVRRHLGAAVTRWVPQGSLLEALA